MVLKDYKKSLSLSLAIAISVIVLFFTVDKVLIEREKDSLVANFMTLDLGMSQFLGFTDSTKYLFTNSLNALSNIIQGFPDRPDIDRIDIDIKLLDFKKILTDREESLKNSVLYKPQKVKAKIRFKNAIYKARIRLKGDLHDHWNTKIRMSLRVTLKGKKTINGLKSFSIQKPKSRKFPYDDIFQKLIRSIGNLSSNHTYMYVFVNGKNWGIMDIEEHISKEFLEKQNVKDSLVVKLSGEDSFYYARTAKEKYKNYRVNDQRLHVKAFSAKKYLKDSFQRQYLSYITQLSVTSNTHDLFDTDTFSKAILTAMIWNKTHTLANHNTRFYFNPYILKLQPITTDQPKFTQHGEKLDFTIPKLFSEKFDSYNIIKHLSSINKNSLFSTERINGIVTETQNYFPNDYPIDTSTLINNINQITRDPNLYIKQFIDNSASLTAQLSLTDLTKNKQQMTSVIARDIPTHTIVNHYSDGNIHIYNLLDVPLKLNGIYYKNQKLNINYTKVPPYTKNNGLLVIKSDKEGIQDGKISVKTSLMGFERTQDADYTLLSDIYNPLLDNSNELPSFISSLNNGYKIKTGTWQINKALVINGALSIEAGTRLQFSENSYLIVKGSLNSVGSKDSPIIMEPISIGWKGLYVLEANNRSELKYTHINKTTGLTDGILNLTGGVVFYNSDVNIFNTLINGTTAEDALNIINSNYEINTSKIQNTRSDGFDSDFSKGAIINSSIKNIGGDALDFSGGNVEISEVTLQQVHDKGVSAGEGSHVKLSSAAMFNIGVGLASKDGSHVNASNIEINDFKLHAAMTYVKKDFYGKPSLNIFNINHNGVHPYSRQIGTLMTLDGIQVTEKKVDVKSLYNSEVMKK